MIRTITQNDVLRYTYNETSQLENKQIQNDILINDDLSDTFYEVSETKSILDSISLEPSQKSIDAILAYSRSTNLQSA